jgi:hypothetical protein
VSEKTKDEKGGEVVHINEQGGDGSAISTKSRKATIHGKCSSASRVTGIRRMRRAYPCTPSPSPASATALLHIRLVSRDTQHRSKKNHAQFARKALYLSALCGPPWLSSPNVPAFICANIFAGVVSRPGCCGC